MIGRIALLLSAFAAAGSATQAVAAKDALRDELAVVAREVARALKVLQQESIAVGQFTSPPQLEASAGPGIVKLLGDELGRLGIAVRPTARYGLNGKYVFLESGVEAAMPPRAKIAGELVGPSGQVLFSFNRELRDAPTLATLFGATAELPPDRSERERLKALEERIVRPQADLGASRISAGPGSLYAIEVWVVEGRQYRPRTPAADDGLAFVRVDRGERYAVKLVNDAEHDVAVTLTIDGLNLFAFSDSPQYSYVIVPARSSGFITGWHRSNTMSDAFEVTSYSRSAVAQALRGAENVGTITARFAAAWPKDARPPADERSARLGDRGSENATGRGPQIDQKYREVERKVGVVRASVSVRYARAR